MEETLTINFLRKNPDNKVSRADFYASKRERKKKKAAGKKLAPVMTWREIKDFFEFYSLSNPIEFRKLVGHPQFNEMYKNWKFRVIAWGWYIEEKKF